MGFADVVQTARLDLRPVTSAAVDAVWEILGDPRTNVHNPAGPMRDRSEAVALTDEWAANWASDGQGYWAVARHDDPGVVIGFGGIRHVQWRGVDVYNLSYRLTPSAWGQGFASEVVEASVRRWHELGERHPLIAYTTSDNIASQKTALRGGLIRRPELDEVMPTYTDVVFALGLDRLRSAIGGGSFRPPR